jgi:peptidoglycan/LPS O-acetylase OafA/YrhL
VNVRAGRFPLMDSLRAIAAICVLMSHAALFAKVHESESPLSPYTHYLGEAGVTIFFLISGFLLYRPFVRARFAGEPAPSSAAYGWRRFLRIVPAYWIALTAIALWLSIDAVFDPAWHIPVFYGFAQIYDATTDPSGLGQAWTLSVEVTFYAFLPLWAYAMRKRGLHGEFVGLGALWLVGLGWKVFATLHVDPSAFGGTGPWLHPLPNFIDQFAVGMALAVVSVHGLPPVLERAVSRAWPWWLTAVLAYWALCRLPSERFGAPTFITRHELATLFALCLLVPAAFAWERRDAVRWVLSRRTLLYTGLVSYGVFLWHYAAVFKLAVATRSWDLGPEAWFVVLCLLGLAGSIAIATVSYYAIERPALSLKRLVGSGERPEQPAEALAEPAPVTPGAAK